MVVSDSSRNGEESKHMSPFTFARVWRTQCQRCKKRSPNLKVCAESPIKFSLRMTLINRGVHQTPLLMSFLSAYSRSSPSQAFAIRKCALNNWTNLAKGDMLCAYISHLYMNMWDMLSPPTATNSRHFWIHRATFCCCHSLDTCRGFPSCSWLFPF